MRALFISGEVSGDQHAGRLIESIKSRKPDIEIAGIGGPCMREAGAEIIHNYESIATVGFTEIFRKIPELIRARNKVLRAVRKKDYNFVVFVDFPGFNLYLSRFFKKYEIPLFYFIPPQVWAWGEFRLQILKTNFRHIFVAYPFEEKYFRERGIDATFTGSPLTDSVRNKRKIEKVNLPEGSPLIAILPGSRESEVKRLLPDLLEGCRKFLSSHHGSAAVISMADSHTARLAEKIVTDNFKDIPVTTGRTRDILYQSDLAIIASGTATVESMLLNTPVVAVYRFSPLTYLLARTLIHIRNFSLVNLLSEKNSAPELLQREVNPERIEEDLEKAWKNRNGIIEHFQKIKKKLGPEGSYERIADKILSII